MARKTPTGQFIISAAEVGSFVVCQEAWRLKELTKNKINRNSEISEGEKLHKDWAAQYDEALYLSQAVRIIILLLLIALFFHLSLKSNG